MTPVIHGVSKIFKEIVLKNGRSEGWKPSSRSFGSGEGLSNGITGLAFAEETSSWIGSGSTRRGSSGGVFSRMRSNRTSPSAVVLWVNVPPVAMLSCRTDSLLRPNHKSYNNTWFGIDKSRPDLDRIEK